MWTTRRTFLAGLAATPACRWRVSMPGVPVLFVGHGSPMHGIEDNRWSRAFAALGHGVPAPRAVLVISAHWETDGPATTGQSQPPTIHDFGGFPQALHDVQYPAPGHVELAQQVADLTTGQVRTDWGLDHGTWCVLRRMFPAADVPVIQLSIDRGRTPAQHLALGRALAPLRDAGVLIVGSGNIVHNLRDAVGRMRGGDRSTPAWAARFDEATAQAVQDHDLDRLAALGTTDDGRRAHPTPEHWLPMLYAAGASRADDPVTFPIDGFDWGSLSMRAVRFG